MRRREFILLAGPAVVWPLAARAQPSRQIFRMAIAHPSLAPQDMSEGSQGAFFPGLFGELRRLGYVEGQNLIVERYSAQGRAQHFPELARAVVRTKPDLILVFARRLVQQFAAATTDIPIVVGTTLDPVGHGIANSLAQPGRNLTGVTMDAGLSALTKHIELLRIIAPNATRIGFLAPEEAWNALYGRAMQEAARQVGVMLIGPGLGNPVQEPEYQRVFAAMEEAGANAIIVGSIADNDTHARLIVETITQLGLPAIYPNRDYIAVGGLMAYMPAFTDHPRLIAGYIDRILTGTKPGDLPFQQPSTWQLIINLKGAKALSLDIPPELLAQADEVIE